MIVVGCLGTAAVCPGLVTSWGTSSRCRSAGWRGWLAGRLAGVAGSVGDGLLRAVLEPGFVGPLQVPHARRREYRSDCDELDRGCDPERAAHPDPGRRHSCEGESERVAQQGAEPVIGADTRE